MPASKIPKNLRKALIDTLTENAANFKPAEVGKADAKDKFGFTPETLKQANKLYIDDNRTGTAYGAAIAALAGVTGFDYYKLRDHISANGADVASGLPFPTLSAIKIVSNDVSGFPMTEVPKESRIVILEHNIKGNALGMNGETGYQLSPRDKLELVTDKDQIVKFVDNLTDAQVNAIKTHNYFKSVVDRALAA